MSLETNRYQDVMNLHARLANLRTSTGYAFGIEAEAGIMNLTATGAALGLPVPKNVDDLLHNGLGAQVRTILDTLKQKPEAAVLVPLKEAAFGPIVMRPEKIICIAINYKKQAEESGTPFPKEPPLFAKYANALNHHGGTVKLLPGVDSRVDYETELVVVMGRECKDVKQDDALDYVAGYATGNDVSARILQMTTSQFTAGKISDGFAPVGPWLVTRDRVPDPNNLRLQTHLNGEQRQDSNTKDMIFDCKELIEFCSSILTLKPGDIIFTGTPPGDILGEKIPAPLRHWLKPGDEVVSNVEGLGDLRFTMI